MVHMKLTFALAAAALAVPLAATAQDTRKVTEPAIPPACTILKAKIGRAGTSIVPEDETKLDTARIRLSGRTSGGAAARVGTDRRVPLGAARLA
jgi:polygalacturonase